MGTIQGFGNHRLGDTAGFSLVEMLVVVGIIGFLTAIAVPQYQAATARSRQSQAKTMLSAIYTAEHNFSTEYGSYSSCLAQMGFQPTDPALYYAVGFASNKANTTTCLFNGNYTQACNFYSQSAGAQSTCRANPISYQSSYTNSDISFSSNTVANSSAGAPTDTNLPANGLGLLHFSAGAAGNISSRSNQFDTWQINDSNILQNTQLGIQ